MDLARSLVELLVIAGGFVLFLAAVYYLVIPGLVLLMAVAARVIGTLLGLLGVK